MSQPCKLGVAQLTKERSWCVTHNQLLKYCEPAWESLEGRAKQAWGIVMEFWRGLPACYRTLDLLEGPCEALIQELENALAERQRGNNEQGDGREP